MNKLYIFLLFFLSSFVTSAQVGFTAPDTVCVGQQFVAIDTSVGASNNYWSFCDFNLPTTPALIDLGNVGATDVSTYGDVAFDGSNYYMFISNFGNGTITRLDFGNSMGNTPTGTNLGTLGGDLTIYLEGIQIREDNGNWYGFVVNWTNNNLIRLFFGSSLTNVPTAINLDNIGSLDSPHYLYIWFENNNWYGITLNQGNNTLTRFSFGSTLANTPTGVNAGTLGAGNGSGASALHKVNGQWYLFIPDYLSSTITRLDFGSSLLNAPVSNNLGNPDGLMNEPLAISIVKDCNKIFGYVTNYSDTNLVLLDFGGSITSTPVATIIGGMFGYEGTHYISNFYRGADTLYSFFFSGVYSADQLIRGAIPMCNNPIYPNSDSTNISSMAFNQPGTYQVNLSVDFGLPTQDNDCGTVVVLPCSTPPVAAFESSDTTFCANNCINFTDLSTNATSWQWTFTGGNPSTSAAENPQGVCYTGAGIFTVTLFASNPAGTDTLTLTDFIHVIAAPPTPVITQSHDTLFCATDSSYTSYQWFAESNLIQEATDTFLVITQSGNYNVQVTNANGCSVAAGVNIIINGIENYNSDNVIGIYPNPVGNQFTIHNSQFTIKEIEIYNVLGQVCLKSEITNPKSEIVVDVSELANGVYLLQLITENKVYSTKMVKE